MARPISPEHASGTSVCPPFARRVICEAFGSLRYCSFSGFWSERRSMATSICCSLPYFAGRGSFGQAFLKPLHLHASMRAYQRMPMPKFVIEREVPGAGNLTDAELRELSQKSVKVLKGMGPEIQWLHSYVTGDKVYCVYLAQTRQSSRNMRSAQAFLPIESPPCADSSTRQLQSKCRLNFQGVSGFPFAQCQPVWVLVC